MTDCLCATCTAKRTPGFEAAATRHYGSLKAYAASPVGSFYPHDASPGRCEVPGCYVCKRDKNGELYPRFP